MVTMGVFAKVQCFVTVRVGRNGDVEAERNDTDESYQRTQPGPLLGKHVEGTEKVKTEFQDVKNHR